MRLFRVATSNQRRTILGGVGREPAGGFRDGASWPIPRWNAAMSLPTLPALLRIERNLASALQDDPIPGAGRLVGKADASSCGDASNAGRSRVTTAEFLSPRAFARLRSTRIPRARSGVKRLRCCPTQGGAGAWRPFRCGQKRRNARSGGQLGRSGSIYRRLASGTCPTSQARHATRRGGQRPSSL